MRRDQLKNFSFLPLKCAIHWRAIRTWGRVSSADDEPWLAWPHTQHRQVNRRPAIQIGDSYRIAHSLFCSYCCATKRALVLPFWWCLSYSSCCDIQKRSESEIMYRKWRGRKERKKREMPSAHKRSRVLRTPIRIPQRVKHVIDV